MTAEAIMACIAAGFTGGFAQSFFLGLKGSGWDTDVGLLWALPCGVLSGVAGFFLDWNGLWAAGGLTVLAFVIGYLRKPPPPEEPHPITPVQQFTRVSGRIIRKL